MKRSTTVVILCLLLMCAGCIHGLSEHKIKNSVEFEQAIHLADCSHLILRNLKVQTFVNIGPRTAPATFRFQQNAWVDLDSQRTPSLPVPEREGLYLQNLSLERSRLTDTGYQIRDDRIKGVGPQAYTRSR